MEPPAGPPPSTSALAELLPDADVHSRHETEIHGSAAAVYAALLNVDVGGSRLIRILFRLRGMSGKAQTLSDLQHQGFIPLRDVSDAILVLGIVGQFWTPSGRLQRLSPEEFHRFGQPGWAKAVWGFHIEAMAPDRVRLVTETHVRCYGPTARRRFTRYWFFVGPFSGLIRRDLLRLIRRAVEGRGDRR